ncbi:hypothetical protein ACFFQF_04185 [Haladaptatus pallidirubidus]|uniref:DUF3592 domain-containing protein n=1 Tax=Haladaptatus pallidirubidus TaxID=1008152 RepID=A0AAV3UKZ9_9EURY|nr:hypothetical protein [Haladaptatus pallidirubidus]
MVSNKQFALFFTGLILMVAGVFCFFVFADYDYRYESIGQSKESPDGRPWQNFAELSPNDRKTVQGAMEGKEYTFESKEQLPPEAVKKDETYYYFDHTQTPDWSDAQTPGTLLVSLLGLLTVFQSIRLELGSRSPANR